VLRPTMAASRWKRLPITRSSTVDQVCATSPFRLQVASMLAVAVPMTTTTSPVESEKCPLFDRAWPAPRVHPLRIQAERKAC